MVTLLVHNKGE